VTLVGDRNSGVAATAINLPFPFQFFGTTYMQVFPSVNGVLYFTAPVGTQTGAAGRGYLPTDLVGPAAAPFWDDLFLDAAPGSDICFALAGNAPNRRFALHWFHAHRIGQATVDLDFEVVLDEGNGIDFEYRALSPSSGAEAPWADGSRAAVGLQSGYSGWSVVHDATVSASAAVHFSPNW
jgi:hypothetical protein